MLLAARLRQSCGPSDRLVVGIRSSETFYRLRASAFFNTLHRSPRKILPLVPRTGFITCLPRRKRHVGTEAQERLVLASSPGYGCCAAARASGPRHGASRHAKCLEQEEAAVTQRNVSEEELTELIVRTAEAAKAYIRGDMRTYFTLIRHGTDYTLMSPFGGEPTRGVDTSPERLAALARFFRSGEAEQEVVETYTSGDLVVLVVIERQHGEVGGLPAQDWSLRVTLVFRHDGSGWRQVHRHADALVHPINLEQLAALARGAAWQPA
jgi:ketosteroid isomerase-like protein